MSLQKNCKTSFVLKIVKTRLKQYYQSFKDHKLATKINILKLVSVLVLFQLQFYSLYGDLWSHL